MQYFLIIDLPFNYNTFKIYKYRTPKKIAIPKLNKVSIKIYSVSFLSLDDVKSSSLKKDFTAKKKPRASQRFVTTKAKINKRSKTPIYRPALARE